MEEFINFYPEIYTKDDLQYFVLAGFVTQEQVDTRIAEVGL